MKKKVLPFIMALVLVSGLTPTIILSSPAQAAATWEWAIEPTWESVLIYPDGAPSITNGLIRVGRDAEWGVNDWGLMDTNGNMVVPFQYHEIGSFYEGYAVVMTIGGARGDTYISNSSFRWGVIDTEGNTVIPLGRHGFRYSSEGLISFKPDQVAFVLPGGTWGYMDKNANIIIPAEYDNTFPFREGLAAVVQDNRMGFIDKIGNVVIPFEYNGSSYSMAPRIELRNEQLDTGFREGLAVVSYGVWPNTGTGVIDRNNNIVVPFGEYDLIYNFQDGFAAVRNSGRWGFVNSNGELAIPLEQYAFVRSFSDGLAAVRRDWDKAGMGFIDKSGNVAIPFMFDHVEPFNEGFAAVWNSDSSDGRFPGRDNRTFDYAFIDNPGKWGFIDTSGNVVLPIEFDNVAGVSNGLALVQRDGLWGIVRFMDAGANTPSTAHSINVIVNGTALTFDQPPIIQDGRTLVPLRVIFEALGADVTWEQATQTVTAERDDVTVSLRIGSNVLARNDELVTLDVPAQIVGERTLVPARAVAESFGAQVDWEQSTRTVTIEE